MTTYADLLGPTRVQPGVRHAGATPPDRVIAGRAADMQLNAAGGYVFKTDDWTTLRRFLILGTTEGTYYVSSETLSAAAMKLLDGLIALDPVRVVDEIVAISEAGSPLKQSPCIFAIARCCSRLTGDPKRDTNNSDPVTLGRAHALTRAPRVLRTFQHVFEFLDYCRRQRGGGSGLTNLLSKLVLDRRLGDVEYQALKYRNREGWKPRDLLRYAHPRTMEPERSDLFAWIVKPESEGGQRALQNSARLLAFEALQKEVVPHNAAILIRDHRLTHEFVPNTLLGDREVWEALLPNLPLTALTRNLRKMTQVGLLVDGKDALQVLREKLVNAESLKKARLHPLRIMSALRQYRSGTSRFGHGGDFTPSAQVMGMLEEALELSFRAVEPLNKSLVIGLDSSGSMASATTQDGMTASEAAAALALWYKRTESDCKLLAFDTEVKLVNVSNRTTLTEIQTVVGNMGGGTNCTLPYRWCLENDVDPEVIMMITDSETWHGGYRYGGSSMGQPVEVLSKLRKRSRHPIVNVIAATTATSSTLGDLKDPHTLEVVGFDPTVPEAVAAFTREVLKEG